ncbi:amidohydrolase family protein [Myxococcus sp. RHSTA-1-4]|uniref:amidohydrolase family protein n=1 Tax=Myxococcus sp. RHSTA-1-4 TaxID=2874601 RepID=UPI001CC05ABF|nr:amidohydrolase family protein [Myxococcus sp. RHSTA-1-4]MBZ4420936.1 amidohydrolase [Myxococcus sp. RHSTA-1-4]
MPRAPISMNVHGPWLALGLLAATGAAGQTAQRSFLFNDSHVHLTNYVQEGTDIRDMLRVMGNKVGRATLFGIPLQQQWSHRVSGEFAPTYYLQTDAPLYYYSFTDAFIANAYLSLPREQRARFDPMITGFNPTDMYAVDHIRRVLTLYPGVFSGIGEFTIHKEFVSAKVAGEVASLTDPAVDRILDFAGEVGLLVILHNDIDVPFAEREKAPVHFEQLKALFRRHPKTPIIWAHLGVGRVVRPVLHHLVLVEEILADPELRHVHMDFSWSEVAKYAVATPETTRRVAETITRYPDRFLFGTDEVAPANQADYLRVYEQYAPVLELLAPDVREKLLKGNHERLFDAARVKVRAWERSQRNRSASP